jgi:hypothetical protein
MTALNLPLWTFILISLLFFSGKASAQESILMQLDRAISLRTQTGQSGPLVTNSNLNLTTLPKNSVVRFPKNQFDQPVSHRYGGNHNAKFVGEIEIVSVPGYTDAQVAALNQSVNADANSGKFFLSYNYLRRGKTLESTDSPEVADVHTEGQSPDALGEGPCLKCAAIAASRALPILPTSVLKPEICNFSGIGSDSAINELRSANCIKLYSNLGNITQESFEYAMQVFKNLLQKKFDMSCANEGSGGWSGNPPPAGIGNGCEFVLNDLNQRTGHQSHAFFVNLCASPTNSFNNEVVTPFRLNRAPGSDAGTVDSYSDVMNGAGSAKNRSSVGAFLTASSIDRAHWPQKKASYKKYGWQSGGCSAEEVYAGKCPFPSLELFGLNASNNDSDHRKPLHGAPFKSSNGCDSMEMENFLAAARGMRASKIRQQLQSDTPVRRALLEDQKYMRELAQKGPSLVLNWGPKEYFQDVPPNTCHNCAHIPGKACGEHK